MAMTEEARELIGETWFSRVSLRRCMAADLIALVLAIGFYIVIAADNITSWPANRVLIDVGGTGALFLLVWLLCLPWSIVSNALLYGWPGLVAGPTEVLRGMFWASRRRPDWAKLPLSMRGPPAWMWLVLVLVAAWAGLVVSGSIAAGIDKGEVRILPGPRYEVSASSLHDSAWTRVSAAEYQAYRAKFMRGSSIGMFFALVLIANSGYAVFLRRELLQRISGDPS